MSGTRTSSTRKPTFDAGTMLSLTDGTIMCHNSSTSQLWKLTPYISATCINGTWSSLSSGPNAPPLHLASAVPRDGRVFVAPGGDNAGALVDLLAAEIDNRGTRRRFAATCCEQFC
jgi:hypothetical protein